MNSRSPENQVICCDCLEGMRGLPEECILLTLTSPPYGGLRTYGGHDEWDFMTVARELFRITVQGGVVVWVVQEQIIGGSESGETSRQRLAFADIGFRIHHTMVMARSSGFQASAIRYGRPLEYAFILSKGRPRHFSPIRDKRNKWAGETRNKTNRNPDGRLARAGRWTTRPFGVRGSVWPYHTGRHHTAGEGYAHEHPALMPEKMAEDHVLSWSKVGDLVFDPFAGAGTTLKMARLNYRRYLGFESNPRYAELARRRLRDVEANMALAEMGG